MKRLTIIGAIILIVGGLSFPFLLDEVSGFSKALAIGLVIGGAFTLMSQVRNSSIKDNN